MLGHGLLAEGPGDLSHGPHQGLVVRAFQEITHEGTVDLDVLHGQLLEIEEGRGRCETAP